MFDLSFCVLKPEINNPALWAQLTQRALFWETKLADFYENDTETSFWINLRGLSIQI